MICYGKYKMKAIDLCIVFLKSILLIGIIAYFFYRSFLAVFFLSPIAIVLFMLDKTYKKRDRLWKLNLEFKELLLSVAAGLQAGYSIENAFLEGRSDLTVMYGNDSYLAEELKLMEKAMRNNIPMEEYLSEFARRSNLEDILEFSDIFLIAKRNGGNLNHILRYGAEKISEKIKVKEEIQTVISARKYELKIMCMIPFFIISYIDFTSPGFFYCLYGNVLGVIIMSCCLLAYLLSILLGNHILDISL